MFVLDIVLFIKRCSNNYPYATIQVATSSDEVSIEK